MEKNNREVDLFDLLEKFGKKIYAAGVSVVRMVENYFKFLFKNAVIMIIFIAMGVGIAYFYFSQSKPYYITSFKARVNSQESKEYKPYFVDLTEMLDDEQNGLLAKKLKLTVQEVSKIKSINCFARVMRNNDEMYDIKLHKVELSDTSIKFLPEIRFEILTFTNDTVILKKISHNIAAYFCSPEIIKLENENTHNRMRENINVINEQIRVIDSIQRHRNISSASLVVTEKKEERMYQDIIYLTERRQYIEKLLSLFPDPINITDEISFPLRVNTPFSVFTKFIILFFVFGMMSSLIYQRIREKIKSKSQ